MSKTNTPLFDVAGIGNAIVDVLSFCEESFLEKQKLAKGSMMLIDQERAGALYSQVGQSTECSGGSVANTLAGMASLGGRGAFIGKVADDQLGGIFAHDMRAVGVHFASHPVINGPSTASCLVFVTKDAQRTMGTFIGACSLVSEEDIDEDTLKNAAITYIEGYLWDTPNAKAAIRKAIALAKKHGRKVAFTLSDTFCVDRHREEFMELIGKIDIMFANESELKSLFETDDVDYAINKIRGTCPIIAITRGAKGSVVVTKDAITHVPTREVSKVVDTTGAGDLYASGFLYALCRGQDLKSCAILGNACAGEIIQQLGARSMKPLRELVA